MTATVPARVKRAARKMAARKKLDPSTLLATARAAYLAEVAALAPKYAAQVREFVEHDLAEPNYSLAGGDAPRVLHFMAALEKHPLCADDATARLVIAASPHGDELTEVDYLSTLAAELLTRDILDSLVGQGMVEHDAAQAVRRHIWDEA